MSKLVIGLIVAGVVVVGGVAAYFVVSGDDGETSSTDKSSQEEATETADSNNDSNEFAPVSTEGLAFVATIETTTGGRTVKAVMEYDGDTKYRYISEQQGQELQVITTPDASYMKIGDNEWFKYGAGNQTTVNTDDYQYDESKLAEYKSSSSYKGTQACGSATCDVWETSSDAGTTTIYLDTETHRIVKVETKISGGTSTITYDYKDVTITPPANAKTFPTAGQ